MHDRNQSRAERIPNGIRLYAWGYRTIQRALHALNLHYMPPTYPEGDVVLWCHWCGARSKVARRG